MASSPNLDTRRIISSRRVIASTRVIAPSIKMITRRMRCLIAKRPSCASTSSPSTGATVAGIQVAEPDQLALHPPVPPRGVLRRDADHELADRCRRGRPPGTTTARIVPLMRDQPTMPGQQRRRGHQEHVAPPPAGDPSRDNAASNSRSAGW
jgi:hypothetical protein